METTSHPLAIESFSHSWLSNRRFSLDGLNNIEPLRPSLDIIISNEPPTSEETMFKMVVTPKTFPENSQTFNFDFPISETPPSLVHADEIFSHGHILPMYREQSNPVVPSQPTSSISLKTVCLLRKWRKSSKRVLQKYFGFCRPFSRKVVCSRRSVRVDDIDRKVWEVRSWNNSPQASPPPQTSTFSVWKAMSWNNSPLSSPPRSPPCYGSDWVDESSIYEAILHCKRSFDK